MIEFMRGVGTPVNTVVIPTPARISSINAGYLPSRSRMRNLTREAAGVLQVHEQIADRLRHPGMRGIVIPSRAGSLWMRR